ncbi:MAG: sulfurtransferase [Gammaproteobacteria bacterium]|nr:sulfurtransferase [Gammaproteobacteria bacterium]
MSTLPFMISPQALQAALQGTDNILVVDLGNPERFANEHIAGSVWLDYADITRSDAPAAGLVAFEDVLSAVFSKLGLTPDTHIVACDDAGNGKAARLCYTLDCIGHNNWSLLDGGIPAWVADGFALTDQATPAIESNYNATYVEGVMWNSDQILSQIHNDDFVTLDARSADEFTGLDVKTANGGHIPNAAHYEWTRAMDIANQKRLRSVDELRDELEAADITPNKQIVAYCQTHHRSAYSYVMLKYLGYSKVAGYPGAWSDWGNNNNLPVEV